ncbi:MAG: FAD-binding oxidoreductase [Proteobacteria bacterium]|nr:FAD-binding oxidoreductase [Pseudomonadota bacterium]
MLLEKLKNIVGEKGWITDPASLEPFLSEWRDSYHGQTAIMLMPQSTEEVSAVVRACVAVGTAIVPQGGNTGLCGGAIPDASGKQVLLSLSRMNRIRALSPSDYSIVAEAGCILADVQAAAAGIDRLFPLSLAAEGSCQIGGNLSTNAGGTNVLRYGTAREQVLGLEVVLANGDIWDGLRMLRKDNCGYDIKQLFIGAEGTLGIITAASLRLFPCPENLQTALIAVADAQAAVDLFAMLRARLSDRMQAFELIPDRAMRYVLKYIADTRCPFPDASPWYVLLEYSAGAAQQTLADELVPVLESGLAHDIVLAKNSSEQQQMWRLRHSISEAQKREGASLKHDVSVPVGEVGHFIAAAESAVLRSFPGARVVAFGHVGDGNVHFNVSQPKDDSAGAFLERRDAMASIVYDVVERFGGSISAEHGIGVLKRGALIQYRSQVEVAVMRAIKAALDPDNLMNPGKVL